MGIASLVLGIVALLMTIFTVGVMGWLSILLGIVGIILGAMGRKNPEDKVATAGLITSLVATVLSLVLYLACVACIGGLSAISETGAIINFF